MWFSSLSESGFIPTIIREHFSNNSCDWFSSLSESGFIPTIKDKETLDAFKKAFSSLSESGFIPTRTNVNSKAHRLFGVLISFREWLHSY